MIRTALLAAALLVALTAGALDLRTAAAEPALSATGVGVAGFCDPKSDPGCN